jgi:hypothetical protein
MAREKADVYQRYQKETTFPQKVTIPKDAIGFLAARHDKPEPRFALYHPDGRLSNTFAIDQTAKDIGKQTGLDFRSIDQTYNHHGAETPIYSAHPPSKE